jgi:hypothetical protein
VRLRETDERGSPFPRRIERAADETDMISRNSHATIISY